MKRDRANGIGAMTIGTNTTKKQIKLEGVWRELLGLIYNSSLQLPLA